MTTSLPADMQRALMTGIRRLRYDRAPIPEPSPGEVLVRVHHVGVCGSDLHYYADGRIGDFVVDGDFVLGHEAAGEVVALGEGVTGLAAGQLVAMEPGIPCGRCSHCLSGRYNLCPDVIFWATPPVGGVFQEYVTHPVWLCFPLPEGMSTIEGAMIEPLAVGWHAGNLSEAKIGQTAVILGAGCIGLMNLLALRARGLRKIHVIDRLPLRLGRAAALGAASVINNAQTDPVAAVMEATNGRGADLVFENAGHPATTALTAELVARGGTIVLTGMAADPRVTYNFGPLMSREATIRTVFRYHGCYPAAIEAVASGLAPVLDVVSDIRGFSELESALADNLDRKAEIVKMVIDMRT
ncbi:MAG: NAD(P)-dependent alcohol dehydrogenase [Bacillota bacterium]|nr:NAD(P)-dependent alcohol dehydrogenase [Bacillota bacterium]